MNMKKAKILFVGAAICCLPILTRAVSFNTPEYQEYTFYFFTSCGTYHQFTLWSNSGAPIADAHNTAVVLAAADCGPNGPVPKVYMMAPQ